MAMASTSTPAGLVQGHRDGPEDVVDRTSTSGSTSSLRTKLMASTTGAIMTASLMTPFDVLKTRLQTASHAPSPSTYIIPSTQALVDTSNNTTSPQKSKFKVKFTSHTHPNHSSGHSNHNYLRATHAHAHAQNHHPTFPFTNPHRLTLPLHPTPAQVQGHTLHPSNISLYAPRLSLMTTSTSSGSGMSFIPNPTTLNLDLNLNPTLITTTTMKTTRTTALQELLSIIQTSGARGLWKGTGTAVLQSIPSAGIYMVGYDYLVRGITEHVEYTRSGGISHGYGAGEGNMKIKMNSRGENWLDKGGIPFIAGCLARTASATICSPLELFRTRLQARPAAGQPTPTYASTLSTILQTITHSGPSSLYRGLGLTLLRDVPFSGLYWVVFEGFRRRIVEGRAMTHQDLPIHTLETGAGRSGNGGNEGGSGPRDRSKLSLWETFTAGAGSGMLAALVTQPFDVLKTRKQVFQPPPPGLPALNTATGIAFKSKFKLNFNPTIATAPNGASMSMSIPRHLVHIVRTEGIKALFSGLGPRTLKIAPACGMMLGCYEGVGRFFGEGEK